MPIHLPIPKRRVISDFILNQFSEPDAPLRVNSVAKVIDLNIIKSKPIGHFIQSKQKSLAFSGKLLGFIGAGIVLLYVANEVIVETYRHNELIKSVMNTFNVSEDEAQAAISAYQNLTNSFTAKWGLTSPDLNYISHKVDFIKTEKDYATLQQLVSENTQLEIDWKKVAKYSVVAMVGGVATLVPDELIDSCLEMMPGAQKEPRQTKTLKLD